MFVTILGYTKNYKSILTYRMCDRNITETHNSSKSVS